jgi:hypothetical protein
MALQVNKIEDVAKGSPPLKSARNATVTISVGSFQAAHHFGAKISRAQEETGSNSPAIAKNHSRQHRRKMAGAHFSTVLPGEWK